MSKKRAVTDLQTVDKIKALGNSKKKKELNLNRLSNERKKELLNTPYEKILGIDKRKRLSVHSVEEVQDMLNQRWFDNTQGIDHTAYIYLDGLAIKVNESHRIKTFQKSGTDCQMCGMKGAFYAVELLGDRVSVPVLNLYGIDENGVEIVFTSDHIIPRSLGGANGLHNRQTTCYVCNNSKGNLDRPVEKVYDKLLKVARELRINNALELVNSFNPAQAELFKKEVLRTDPKIKLKEVSQINESKTQVSPNRQSNSVSGSNSNRGNRGRFFWVHA